MRSRKNIQKGAQARVAKLTAEQRREIAKKAAEARWSKKRRTKGDA
jgi:glutathione synthase/RimK-type ligase-like ATP-grasp enzyme